MHLQTYIATHIVTIIYGRRGSSDNDSCILVIVIVVVVGVAVEYHDYLE